MPSDEIYKFVSWDPGEGINKPSIGMTCWSPLGKALRIEQLTRSELIAILEELKNKGVEVFIIEEYRVFPTISHNWSEVATIETIGILIGWALTNDVYIVKQPASKKEIAEKWSGQKSPKKHDISHGPDSWLQGYYYLSEIGIIPPRVLRNYAGNKSGSKDKGSSKGNSE